MAKRGKRQYVSELRSKAAGKTRSGVLTAAKTLFARQGIDAVTIAQIAEAAGVAPSTVYSLFKSKEGILRSLMEEALFGSPFQEALAKLNGVTDPIALVRLSAHVARAIYQGESAELGLMRGVSAFSPALRKIEREFEDIRFEMQEQRIKLLFAKSRQRRGLEMEDARRILWMYTSREIYRMLVHESGWTPDQYQQWLSDTLVTALVRSGAAP